ncbi:MAG: hypothetical protein GF308_10465 [Candidatus Heimdallarchaeota archaeon]|nr:hypothetical protein [Candidatus Heimdallarchaeota archaeon]
MVDAYPNVLPKEILTEITVKSMPLSAKDGDFTTNTVSNENAFSGYVFSIPSEKGRDNIASLLAVFESMNYNPNIIRKVFAVTISELRKNNQIDEETLTNILPGLHQGLKKGHIKIKISSVVTIEFEIDETESDKDPTKEFVSDFSKDMWK